MLANYLKFKYLQISNKYSKFVKILSANFILNIVSKVKIYDQKNNFES